MNKVLSAHLRSLQKQLKDACSEGKIDCMTYNSMMIDLNAIQDICEQSLIDTKID